MAKYRLQKSNNVVSCEVLNESDGQYVVRFGNGVIQKVPRYRVFQLDHIDEGVLDALDEGKIADFGRKVASKFKDVVGKISAFIKKGFLFFEDKNGKQMNVMSPVNIMIGAGTTGKCINFIPGSDVQDCCEYYGLDSFVASNYDLKGEYSGSLQPDELARMIGSSNISIDGEMYKSSIKEGYRSSSDIIDALFEDNIEDKYGEIASRDYDDNIILSTPDTTKGEGKGGEVTDLSDYTKDDLIEELLTDYEDACNGNDIPLPFMIWGAPGIGKTSIIRGLQKGAASKINVSADRISVITIGAGNIGPDSFTMPAQVSDMGVIKKITQDMSDDEKREIEAYNERVRKNRKYAQNFIDKSDDNPLSRNMRYETPRIKDLPKNWVPVYDPRDIGEYTEKELDNIANGGWYEEDGTEHVGYGGFIFIDEFMRMTEFGKASIMNLPSDRLVANSLKLGSKWIVVCASNRFQDMNIKPSSMTMELESAVLTRFRHVNYVPLFDDWKQWSDDNGGVILPEIMEYLEQDLNTVHTANSAHWGDYYNVYKVKKNSVGGDKGRACPRTWESASLNLKGKMRARGVKSLLDLGKDRFGESILHKVVKNNVGGNVATRFEAWLLDRYQTFTIKDAEEVLAKGEDASILLYKETSKTKVKDAIPIVLSMFSIVLPDQITGKELDNMFAFTAKLSMLAGDNGIFDENIFTDIFELLTEKYGLGYLNATNQNTGENIFNFVPYYYSVIKGGRNVKQLQYLIDKLRGRVK